MVNVKNSVVTAATANVGTKTSIPDGHKSMWAINNLHASNPGKGGEQGVQDMAILNFYLFSGLSDMELAAYRTRSLPSWGKGNKQRPVSTADDLEELYAKVGEEGVWEFSDINLIQNLISGEL